MLYTRSDMVPGGMIIVALGNGAGLTEAAVRDAVQAMVIAQMPLEFRLALVSSSLLVAKLFESGVTEALRHGIEAHQFSGEAEAAAWLES